jgi:outer membrane receptor protein involved in Fe transport
MKPLFALVLLVGTAAASDDPAQANKDPFLQDMPTVEAASLHTQTLRDAPANVSIITKEDIRTYGYRTLGEALDSVRGFYMSSDHIYSYAGVRGFSLPGDYNTRFLVMINGHPMTDNVFSANGFYGQDFGLDMDLVERIEVIRGPSSSLYGTNGIFATINVITISPVDFPAAYATAEAGSFGEKKAMAAGSYYLGKGANLLVSGAVYNNTGQSFYFPEFDTPMLGDGHAVGMDGERGYHSFANLAWRNWSILAYFNGRDKSLPLAYTFAADTLFSRGNHAEDARDFVSAMYRHSAGPGELRLQLSYDRYRYQNRLHLLSDTGLSDFRTYTDGDWLSSRITYQLPAGALGTVTGGVEGSLDLLKRGRGDQVWPYFAELSYAEEPEKSAAAFAEVEKRLSAQWKLDAGVRLDLSDLFPAFVSPRVALAYQPSPQAAVKFIYGRPYRDPSGYEQIYEEFYHITENPLPPPHREIANTFEIVLENRLSQNWSGTLNLFNYRLDNLIQAVFLSDGLARFSNVPGTRARGAEAELDGRVNSWLEAGGSFTLQRAWQNETRSPLPNSPRRIGKVHWAARMGPRFVLAGNLRGFSSRTALYSGPQRAVFLADLTFTVRRLLRDWDLQAGVRNALNWSYKDPIGLSLDTIQGDPRSFFVKLVWALGK